MTPRADRFARGDSSRATFLGGVAIAAAFSTACAALLGATTGALAPHLALRAVVCLLGGAYTLYLLMRSDERTGRVATIAAWSAGAVLIGAFASSLGLFLIGHATMAWLVRALYHQRSIVGALVDLGLTTLALAAAVASMRSTGSLPIAIWCFFLIQALFPVLPNGAARAQFAHASPDEPFARAQRSANSALRRLAVRHDHR
jgi:hypothetical protein